MRYQGLQKIKYFKFRDGLKPWRKWPRMFVKGKKQLFSNDERKYIANSVFFFYHFFILAHILDIYIYVVIQNHPLKKHEKNNSFAVPQHI